MRKVCNRFVLAAASRVRGVLVALATCCATFGVPLCDAAQVVIEGPPGSGRFGMSVTLLPNGNFVVTDPEFDAPGPTINVGGAYLYRADGVLLSALRGSVANDRVGHAGVIVLANGNYVVRSPVWRNETGAVTFGSSTAGVEGEVSAANSLVGGKPSDAVGNVGIAVLANGNYLVRSPFWDNGAASDAGAVTFGSGTSGTRGVVSALNSLVGSKTNDVIGQRTVGTLPNGNYVVGSPAWDNGAVVDAGAATFGSGSTGIFGVVSAGNSLVGVAANDNVGNDVTVLASGNYVVSSPDWDDGSTENAGAATFGSGSTGITGAVSAGNSLVGESADDRVGAGVVALVNGNFVVRSPQWDNGMLIDAGAVTFASGVSGISGGITAGNSLVGVTAGDRVGLLGVTALGNGGYVVRSPLWNNGALVDVGAVTFGSGTQGISGAVSIGNSLAGSSANDQIGNRGVVALVNGNYVVLSPNWDSPALADVGAFTFGSGITGATGLVSASNSLVGSAIADGVESEVIALANGNYVVRSWRWNNGASTDAGAVTFGNGSSGSAGIISAANSLVGSRTNDSVGFPGVFPLRNGNYVVASMNWDDGPVVDAGAATIVSGTTGLTGPASEANSVIGSQAGDHVGEGVLVVGDGQYVVLSTRWDDATTVDVGAATYGWGATGISGQLIGFDSLVGSQANDRVGGSFSQGASNGNYVVASPLWDNGGVVDAGAITLGVAGGSVSGPIDAQHSVLGTVAGAGPTQVFGYDAERNQLVVGDQAANRVVLHRTGTETSIGIIGDTPDPSVPGQSVVLTASVSASPAAPADGSVTFRSDSGERCVSDTPTPVSATVVSFSCALSFDAGGTFTVIAEYRGSIVHAYSGSDAEAHAVVDAGIFVDGFEGS